MTTDHFTGITSTGQTAKTDLARIFTLGENTNWFDQLFDEFYDPLLSGTSNNVKWPVEMINLVGLQFPLNKLMTVIGSIIRA